MKNQFKFLTVIFFYLIAFKSTHAQKVIYSDNVTLDGDNIVVSGENLATIKENKGWMTSNYSIRNVDGKELIFMKCVVIEMPECSGQADEVYWEVLFMESKKYAEVGADELGCFLISRKRVKEKLIMLMVDNNVIKDGALNQEGVDNFIFKYGQTYSNSVMVNSGF